MRFLCSLSFVALLSACAAGPDFTPPAPPHVAYTATPLARAMAAGADEPAQRLTLGKAVSSQWWNLFDAPPLDAMIEEGIAHSPTLEAARATLEGAKQAVLQAEGGFYPQADMASSAQRQKGLSSTHPSNVYSVGPTVSFAPDIFGGTRRAVEQAQAQADNQLYQLGAAYLTLTGDIATQAVTLASLRAQLAATHKIIAEDEQNLKLVRDKYQAGKAARTDVLTAQTQLESDRALPAPLEQQVSVARHALAVLIGQFPGQWSAPKLDLAALKLPADLPVSLPSVLVHQRPDILAAEAQLRAASAGIGVAEAKMYPDISLSASVGTQALAAGNLFGASSLIWGLTSGVTTPLFHGGALEAQKQEAVQAFDAAAATYRQTVLQAFGQVADSLRALQHDAELAGAEKSALSVAETSLGLQRDSYAYGKTDLLSLITAERAAEQARLAYIRAAAQRYLDTVQLFVAMGGGWRAAQ
ncbi:MAG: efflux transporter outer membrane subunit [Alphaproteobacteria bacterium]|nr:efflux transporter outer membrane subunit [Alphaproteobacteria bacterium]